jgi:NAD+ synthase (glutamine-hydrolysing)
VPSLRLALAQSDAVVGDLAGNANRVMAACRTAERSGARVVVLPEMFLTGYPIEDLALRASFIAAAQHRLETLARQLRRVGLGHLVVIVGSLDSIEGSADTLGRPKGSPQNIAAVLHDGRVAARTAKQHLPNYGVFDEARYFVPGNDTLVLRLDGIDIAIAICEDVWRETGPVADAAAASAGLLVVINGSPYERNKDDQRLDLCRTRAEQAGCTLAYVNLVGGQDELVFDGDSLVVAADGTLIARAPQFAEDVMVVELELPDAVSDQTPTGVRRVTLDARPRPTVEAVQGDDEAVVLDWGLVPHGDASLISPRITDEEEVYTALTTAVSSYVTKNGFDTVLLGLSGGIDSALTAAIAADALGGDRVYGVLMPSGHSSQHSLDDASDLAARLDMATLTVPIDPMVEAFTGAITIDGLALENLQARVRGMILMSLSNQEGHLVLATGNKSELAVGYSTIYGDAVGGYAPLKDVPKTWVWRLATWRNQVAEAMGTHPPIPQSSIDKPPSAELRPGQLDTDSLPDYHLLDDLLDDYVEQDRSAADLIADGFDPAIVEDVLRKVDHAEYKRRQYPPGPKITTRAFGRDRRLPITNSWREAVASPQAAAAAPAVAPAPADGPTDAPAPESGPAS